MRRRSLYFFLPDPSVGCHPAAVPFWLGDVLAGLFIQYSPVSPMKALFWSAVINGVVADPP